jgi:molecular chaperone GrpE
MMGKRKSKRKPSADEAATPEAEMPPAETVDQTPAADQDTGDGGSALVETPEAAIDRLTQESESQKDRYLRLAAEFDNFRKRMVRERSETTSRAQAQIVSRMLESLDDLSRVAHLDPANATVEDVVSGVELVERKLLRELDGQGLRRIGAVGDPFDPNDHEAVATATPPTDDEDGTVAAVLQVGYKFGSTLLRPARVQVFVASQTDGQPQG